MLLSQAAVTARDGGRHSVGSGAKTQCRSTLTLEVRTKVAWRHRVRRHVACIPRRPLSSDLALLLPLVLLVLPGDLLVPLVDLFVCLEVQHVLLDAQFSFLRGLLIGLDGVLFLLVPIFFPF